ncbi:transporter substrate-binding domain-containing protein [Paucibacter sediminis]|uniref:Transporter substrate-binding domain-containing protein n=1 Tax=Paucibacter sediminis TaxID=3019553 RepID=A0AA95NHM2_9BURK|nr:transporter substrate-binding domain-containing protein [Paucibacter sp. S2-9]WIT14305.1 transporter substrate-binding domain-containing protein [Paucibacter sp. S2-9]
MHRREFMALSGLAMAGRAFAAPAAAPISAPIRMAYFDKYEPFSQRAADGTMSGALIDGIELLGRACGIGFEHHGYPWARAQLLVERGELDALCTVPTPARQAWLEFCGTPLVSLAYGVFHRSDDARAAQAQSLEDLRALRLGSYRGSGYSRGLLKMDQVQIDNDAESVLRRIVMGSLDIFMESELIAGTRIRQLGLAGKIGFTPLPFLPPAQFCFGLRRSHADCSAIVARMEAATVAARQSGALQNLLAKYR